MICKKCGVKGSKFETGSVIIRGTDGTFIAWVCNTCATKQIVMYNRRMYASHRRKKASLPEFLETPLDHYETETKLIF